MAIPTVSREYTPGSCRNLSNPMRHPPRRVMRPDSPALRSEQFLVPNQPGKDLDLLDGTTESLPEIRHKSRTLLKPQECEIARGSPNQLEIKTDSPALAREQFPVPHHT